MALGFVYILSDASMPGCVKIGFSTGDPVDRVAELSQPAGFRKPFRIEYWCLTYDVEQVEVLLHEALAKHRVKESRELFRVDLSTAIAMADRVGRPAPARYVAGPEPEQTHCPRCGEPARGRVCLSCGSVWR